MQIYAFDTALDSVVSPAVCPTHIQDIAQVGFSLLPLNGLPQRMNEWSDQLRRAI